MNIAPPLVAFKRVNVDEDILAFKPPRYTAPPSWVTNAMVNNESIMFVSSPET